MIMYNFDERKNAALSEKMNKNAGANDSPNMLPDFDDLKADDGKQAAAQPGDFKGKKKSDPLLKDFGDEDGKVQTLPQKEGMSAPKPAYDDDETDDADRKDGKKDKKDGKDGEKKDKKEKKEKKAKDAKADKEKKAEKDKKSKDKIALVDNVKPRKTSRLSKFVFILSMCLIIPFALLLILSLILIFALIVTAAILIAGVLGLALVVLVVIGVVLALTGIISGLIEIFTKSDFAFYAGLYELGLGLSITGITIVVSSLLYSGASALVPFVSRQLVRLFKFIGRKIKELVKKIYKYSTSL